MSRIDKVMLMMKQGCGRRTIAKALNTTEWEARRLMSSVMNQVDTCKTKDIKETDKKTRKAIDKDYCRKEKGTIVTVISEPTGSDKGSELLKRKAGLKVAVLSDIHYPYEDAQALKLTREYLLDYQPDMFILNGDILDCYSISRYDKNPSRNIDFNEELEYAKTKIRQWVDDFPDAEFKMLEGNHEERLKKYVSSNAAALFNIKGVKMEHLLDLDILGIEWIPASHELKIGNLLFTHGHLARKHAGSSARGHYESYGCSVLIGHIHRLSTAWKRTKMGDFCMIENGTLCDFNVEYMKFPDWQHGFTTIEFDGADFSPRQHAIVDYKLIADGKVYVL